MWIFPLKIVIFHSYVSLPEGIYISLIASKLQEEDLETLIREVDHFDPKALVKPAGAPGAPWHCSGDDSSQLNHVQQLKKHA